MIERARRRVSRLGLLLSLAAAPAAGRVAAQGDEPAPASRHALGSVTVTIPSPRGFEEVLTRLPDMRARMGDTDRLETLASHLPAEVVRTYKPGQDFTFYTKVSISRAAKTSDVPDAMFAELTKQLAGASVYEQDFVQKRLAELEKERGVTLEKPMQLGVVDRTPKSLTTLMLMTVGAGGRKWNVLGTNSAMHLRKRLLFVYGYRVFETTKDREILEQFTKEWVRAILAANP
jgi:hypothetical protein